VELVFAGSVGSEEEVQKGLVGEQKWCRRLRAESGAEDMERRRGNLTGTWRRIEGEVGRKEG
jgi:hypothetical protein